MKRCDCGKIGPCYGRVTMERGMDLNGTGVRSCLQAGINWNDLCVIGKEAILRQDDSNDVIKDDG